MVDAAPTGPLKTAVTRMRILFLVVLLFSMAVNLLMLTAPIFMLQVFDRVLSSRSVETLLALLAMAAAALLTLAALDGARGVLLQRLAAWLDDALSGETLSRALARSAAGAPTSQPIKDLAALRAFISGPALLPLMDAPWIPFFLGALFLLSPEIGWVATGGAILLGGLAVANELSTRTLMSEAEMQSFAAQAAAEGAMRNADVVLAMGMKPALTERWAVWRSAASQGQCTAGSRITGISAASKFVRLGMQVGILALGAWLVLNEALTPGGMIAASIIMSRALAPIEQAIGSWRQTTSARSAYKRLRAALDEPGEPEAMALPPPTGALEVKGLGHRFAADQPPVLNAVTLSLAPGESLGVVGPTASGKSTLARLLIGVARPTVGSVRLDGVEVADWPRWNLGPHIGYLPQSIGLFPGTIADNIARMRTPDPELVVAAAKAAGAHDMILKLPGGYDHKVAEGGRGLSGGQQQRIGLARALYGDPKLVVLDEPNASVDAEGEAGVVHALAHLKARKATVVVIAHRAGAVQTLDKLMVLREGQVQKLGPREEVLRDILPGADRAGDGGAVAPLHRPSAVGD